jgi:L-amino acid N-acyltransferase YncA
MGTDHRFEVRLAVESDALAINDILNHYVVHSTATFITEPQKLADRLGWLLSRTAAYPVVVVEVAGKLLGWGALSSFRNREAYSKTAEVSVYIHPDHLRRGLGRAILSDLLAKACKLEHHALIGGCCKESTASIALLESFGFNQVGHFPQVGRKFDRWLDVVFLQLLL